jgi:hypothetical protein
MCFMGLAWCERSASANSASPHDPGREIESSGMQWQPHGAVYDGKDVDALDTEEGGAFAREIIDALEHELVRFRHRVQHDHAIELDRARAAMVLLGKLVGAGIKWRPRPDADPARIHEAMSAMVGKDPKIATTLKREIAAFFAATADVEVLPEETSNAPAILLRRVGSDPSLWWSSVSWMKWRPGRRRRAASLGSMCLTSP